MALQKPFPNLLKKKSSVFRSSPFNEANYNALLKGLEVSEVYFSKLKNETNYLRFDSEFQSKEYAFILDILKKNQNNYFEFYIEFLTPSSSGPDR